MKNFALIACAIGMLCMAGCKAVAPDRAAGLGQSCNTTNDCGSSLVCVSGTCMEKNLPLDASANVCAECTADADCTGTGEVCDEGSCEFYCTTDASCTAWSGGFEDACEVATGDCYFYECALDGDCGGGFCDLSVGELNAATGTCRDCGDDSYCASDEVCIDNDCEDRCATDQDCPGFEACNTTTFACEYVGCRTDRECVHSSSGFVGQLVVCDLDTGFCELPCDNDTECISLTGGSNAYCVDGACAGLGCETDDECRVVSGPNSYCVDPSTIAP